MSRVFNGTTQYLSVASTLLTNEPIGMFVWGKCTNIAAAQSALMLGNGGGASGGYWIFFRGDVGGDPVGAFKESDAGAAGVANTSTGYSNGVWAAAGVAYRSDTSRDAYVNGGSKGSNATSVADPTPDFVTIGATRKSTVLQFFTGDEAEAFIFDVAPTDAQMALLGKGIHPVDACILIANIRGWYPLLGNDKNNMAGGYPDLTATGSPTQGAHPPLVISPRLGTRCTL